MPRKTEAPRQRDRGATERALVAAAKEVLADEGFQGFGVNAVARRAGCDKQLIYRYFDGLDGLIDAVGRDLAIHLRVSLSPLAPSGRNASYRDIVERMALGHLQLLRDDTLLRRIAAWEIASPSPLVARLTAARSIGMSVWAVQLRAAAKPPAATDTPALNALILAAIQHLALAGAAAGEFAGLALRKEADWDRARAAVKKLVRALYPA